MEFRLPWSTTKVAGVYVTGPVLSRKLTGQTTSISNHIKYRRHLGDMGRKQVERRKRTQSAGRWGFPNCGHWPHHLHFQLGWPWHNYLAGKIDWQGCFCSLHNSCQDFLSLPIWAASLRDQERPRLLPRLRSPSYLKMKKCQSTVINTVVYLKCLQLFFFNSTEVFYFFPTYHAMNS